MMEIQECVICDASIWPVAPEHAYLCFAHRRARQALSVDVAMARLQLAVNHATLTDWRVGQSHTERMHALCTVGWQPKFDDIMRRAIYWLHVDDGSEAA